MKARRFLGVFLQKEEIPDSGSVVRVRAAKEDTLEGDEGPKLILFFDNVDKGLVCNKTNINVLIDILGSDETDDWIGREVELYVDHGVMFAGKRVGGIRVRAAGPQLRGRLEPTPIDPKPPATNDRGAR